MNHKSIFSRQNQTIIQLFEGAGHPRKVLCFVLDYAKLTHVALCCDGTGKVVKNPFPVKNNPAGPELLLETVDKLCRKHHVRREHVFFGGEDCGTFALNIIYNLRDQGFLVVGVNAADAAKQRENHQASTDKLDLLGIANMLINKRGTLAGGNIGAQRAMRSLTRHRKQQVRWQTATGNRIHQLVDQLFPGFLDERNSAVPPFSDASLYLMEDRFSSRQIARRQDRVLLRQLRAQGLQHAEPAVIRLKVYAREVLEHPQELSGLLQSSLSCEVRLYRCLQENIQQVSREIAQQLARTPAAALTSIRGVGITLAAGVSAEIGPADTQPSLRRLCS
jgi:transposase